MTDQKDDLAAAIRALPHDPEALEAYVRGKVNEAKEEGFWIGRSTGGSKAQIDAAIRAMKGEGDE